MVRCLPACLFVLACAAAQAAEPPTLKVELPDGAVAKSAVAVARSLKLESAGTIEGRTVRFAKLLHDVPYDLQITLADGMVLRGVDMGWYNAEPAKAEAGQSSDDDREQIRKLVQDIRQFYDRSEALLFKGDHDRAVALVQCVRDTPFHSGKPGEVIWRLEVWYFKNQHGGWERISMQNKVLAREKFASRKAYEEAMEKQRFVAELGGVVIPKGEAERSVTLPPSSLRPATLPSGLAKPKE